MVIERGQLHAERYPRALVPRCCKGRNSASHHGLSASSLKVIIFAKMRGYLEVRGVPPFGEFLSFVHQFAAGDKNAFAPVVKGLDVV